ncbi:hypothetical protein A9970_02915 [Sphingobacterium sp. UME9]|nr:hypothetical protein [Sphingobacterium sp. UME9]
MHNTLIDGQHSTQTKYENRNRKRQKTEELLFGPIKLNLISWVIVRKNILISPSPAFQAK